MPASSSKKLPNRGGRGNILSFFQPVAAAPRPLRSRSPVKPSPSALSSSPERSVTPSKRAAAEIGASDDDDESKGEFSDDSLEDLSAMLSRSKNAVPVEQKVQHNPYATPRTKRTAAKFASPLAIMPRRKFDMNALAKDARQDDATTASSLRVKEVVSTARAKETNIPPSTAGDAIAGIMKDNGGQNAQKVLRAVERSGTSQAQPRYLFFEEDYKAPAAPRAPSFARGSPWNLLTQGSARAREQHLMSGLPQTILRKSGGLPDPLFDWMLDSLCVQPSTVTRQEYCNMVASCAEQVERLVTAERLRQLFARLGARDAQESESGTPPASSVRGSDREPYEGRDWSCLVSFISLLGLVAGHLSVQAAGYATQTLLRLSQDRFLLCTADVLAGFEYTTQQLTAALPSSSWDSFCFETCSLLGRGQDHRTIRATSLLCLPISTKRVHDLRRRIAVASLFQDDSLALRNAEDVVTLRGIMDILDTDSFAVTRKTDFCNLRASIILLDMAIDDGSVVKFDHVDDEKKFNEEVDELAGKLQEIWRKINDSGMKLARTEAKSVVEWVQKRLSHSVRTRRKVRKSVFDFPGQDEDPFLPRQRDYMRRFFAKDGDRDVAPC
ncbi:uncharacterized protein MAM_03286 [Metarhizium album ARSEF 1941]|uniref:Uncharacterized protein n=1 Tax=Metarhizium album (strain ARSEF 1941) TaxID=1081103 RepID=A0A0B2WZ37_METAS|nr:uncharacterized protein MAM_03286 [Metarhizium album ARSEF 1941]KHN98824.1 hypothetical protein MAM_03286 [Metarhizium album ARSEF 1941]